MHEGDIRGDTGRVFDEVAPEVCFHLAAQADVRVSVERPDFDADVNVVGTRARAGGRAAARDEDRVQLDRRRDLRRVRRAGATRITRASRSRRTACRSSRARSTSRRTTASTAPSHVSLRFGNVYGPRQDPKGEAGVVAIFMKRLREGGTPRIFGDGTQTRDYVYVGDVVAATLAAAEHGGGVLNVGRASRRRCSTCTSGSSASRA